MYSTYNDDRAKTFVMKDVTWANSDKSRALTMNIEQRIFVVNGVT